MIPFGIFREDCPLDLQYLALSPSPTPPAENSEIAPRSFGKTLQYSIAFRPTICSAKTQGTLELRSDAGPQLVDCFEFDVKNEIGVGGYMAWKPAIAVREITNSTHNTVNTSSCVYMRASGLPREFEDQMHV